MKKLSLHMISRIVYYFSALIILIYSFNSLKNSKIILSMEDFVFLLILCLSFLLVNKYSISLKDTKLVFNDFIVLIVYIKFGISISVILLFVCYLLISIIEYKDNKKLNILMENTHIFNNSLFILSTFCAHIVFSFLNKIFVIEIYQLMFIITFGFIFLLFNYILFCIDLSFQKKVLVLITLQNGLYYVILNSLLCTLIASLAIYLYNFYGYVPIIVMTCFIIFISFAINSLDKLKTTNKNIKAIAECTTHIISPSLDFKSKLQHVIEVIDGIIPFVYCGIYFFREDYENLYPLCYRSNYFIKIEDLKLTLSKDSEVSRMLRLGNPMYKENSYLKDTLALVDTLSSEIKHNLIIPIKHTEASIGFILLCLGKSNNYSEETELLTTLGKHIGMVNFHINMNIKNNTLIHKSYDALAKYIDYNISHKIFFTLAIIEVINFNDIINNYNNDFYLSYKNEIIKLISSHLSSNDCIICFQKEDIYIIFNLLDSNNSNEKLQELKTALDNYNFKDIIKSTKICYALCEYPLESINTDELLAKTYRKLYKEKNA